MTLFSELLQEARQLKKGTYDQIYLAKTETAAFHLDVKPAAGLSAFRPVKRRYGNELTVVLESLTNTPYDLTCCADGLWRLCDGSTHPKKAEFLVQLSQVEFLRSQFSELLHRVAAVRSGWLRPSMGVPEASLERAEVTDWSDTANVMADPFSTLMYGDSSPTAMYNFLAALDQGGKTFEQRVPDTYGPIQMFEVMAGLALAWLDRAAMATDVASSLRYMSLAMRAAEHSSFESGWSGHEEMLRQDAAHHGKAGAKVRLGPVNELKNWALSEAEKMQGADMAIARRLGQKVPQHLANVSVDPQRLIYEALRTRRRPQRQARSA